MPAFICSDLVCPSIEALAEALKTNSSIRDIHLERNGIGTEGAEARLADSPWIQSGGFCRLNMYFDMRRDCCEADCPRDSGLVELQAARRYEP